jgi:hypothetical protein
MTSTSSFRQHGFKEALARRRKLTASQRRCPCGRDDSKNPALASIQPSEFDLSERLVRCSPSIKEASDPPLFGSVSRKFGQINRQPPAHGVTRFNGSLPFDTSVVM